MRWLLVNKADKRAVDIYTRHYSARQYRDGRPRTQIGPPGESMILITPEADALFMWIHNKAERFDHQVGVNCAVFRNEGPRLSSALIASASRLAWRRWPGMRLFTYVEPGKIRSTNPGYCFLRAGWRKCGRNKTGKLVLLERLPTLEDEVDLLFESDP